MTSHPDLFASLAAPFDPHEIKARTQGGRQLHYITARTVMNRLDDVLGPENWWDEYIPHENSVLCKLTVRLPDGTTLTKADAGGYAGMADSGDDDKSGYSDAFKRAAVKFGIARYLYRDGVPTFVQATAPAGPTTPATKQPGPARPARAGARGEKMPATGRDLFKWAKSQEERFDVGVVKYLTQWGKLQDFPARIVDWDPEQARLGLAEASRKLASIQPRGDSHEEADASQEDAYADALSN